MATLLITGAAGRIATALRPRLLDLGHDLVLLDERDPQPLPTEPDTTATTDTTAATATAAATALPAEGRERFVRGSVNDRAALESALVGVDTIVHLAGIPTEDTWEALLDANVTGTKNVLEAAAAAGVPRVLQASSIHAVGRVPEAVDAPGSVPGDRLPRPDTYYGVTKAAMELLGSVFADRFPMVVVSARIGAFGERPSSRRALLMWSSPDDLARLVSAALRLTEPGHHVVWAVSRNSGSPADLRAGERIGFHPEDDASQVLTPAERNALPDEDMRSLGGGMADMVLGKPRG